MLPKELWRGMRFWKRGHYLLTFDIVAGLVSERVPSAQSLWFGDGEYSWLSRVFVCTSLGCLAVPVRFVGGTFWSAHHKSDSLDWLSSRDISHIGSHLPESYWATFIESLYRIRGYWHQSLWSELMEFESARCTSLEVQHLGILKAITTGEDFHFSFPAYQYRFYSLEWPTIKDECSFSQSESPSQKIMNLKTIVYWPV